MLTGLRNTFIGTGAGYNSTGSDNICIGASSAVPTASNSNQIAIGTASETMYIQGGLNYRFSNITATGNLLFPFPQFVVLTQTAVITITLPTVNISHRGAVIKFKRYTGAFLTTINATGGGGAVFRSHNSVGALATYVTIPAVNFQTELICDGNAWYQITMT